MTARLNAHMSFVMSVIFIVESVEVKDEHFTRRLSGFSLIHLTDT